MSSERPSRLVSGTLWGVLGSCVSLRLQTEKSTSGSSKLEELLMPWDHIIVISLALVLPPGP